MYLVKVHSSHEHDDTTISHMNPRSRIVILLFTYSVRYNGIGDAGAQTLAEGLWHCTNLQELK